MQSTAGSVNLHCGDDLLIESGVAVLATGDVNIEIDHGNADAGIGGRAVVLSELGGTNAFITGYGDPDFVRIVPSSTTSILANGANPPSAPGDTFYYYGFGEPPAFDVEAINFEAGGLDQPEQSKWTID